MSKGTKKRYTLHNGVELLVDCERFMYHQAWPTHRPTATIILVKGTVSQNDATKAAGRVMRSAATVTMKRIELSTTGSVTTFKQAFDLCDAFVDELDTLLRSRAKASRNKAKLGNDGGYVNQPTRS